MTQPIDINLAQFLHGAGFHPADTERKQLGHELVRVAVGNLAHLLHRVLPPGRDKSIAFTALEELLMRSNRAVALGGGPREDGFTDEELRVLIAAGKEALTEADEELYQDPRIAEYQARQRGEAPAGR